MTTPRRKFLQSLAATGGVLAFSTRPPALLAQAAREAKAPAPDGRILVLVQLAGGNDGLNTVAPFADDEYRRRRPSLALGRDTVHKLNDSLGLHPQMEGFKELFDAGTVAVVQGVGYPNPNRSHFRSMDIWHSARPDIEHKRDGWMGRAMDAVARQLSGRAPGLALGTARLPLALVSTRVTVPTVRSLEDYQLQLGADTPANLKLRRRMMRELAGNPASSDTDLDFLRRTAGTALDTAEKMSAIARDYQSAVAYPETGLGQRLKTVAQLIAADLGARVYFVTLDGFDTHAEQEGAHAALLGQLSGAVTAFAKDLKAHGLDKCVLTATFSEFGRRVKENGSLGTDHGAAAPLFLIGSAVKAGVHGAHPSLVDLDQGDLKHHTDFRQVYATLLERWLGWPTQAALGGKFAPLPVI